MSRRRRSAALCAVLAAALALGCDDAADDGGRPKVAVSIFPLYDVARRVAGDRLDVVLVLPPGRSEHGFEPTPREMASVAGSDLAFLVGLEMDPWAERIVRSAAGEDVRIVELGPQVDPRRLSAPEVGVDLMEHARAHRHHEDAHDDDHDEDGDHDHDEGEPHADGDHDEHDDHGDHDEHDEHDEDDEDDEDGDGEGEAHAGHHHHHGAHDPHFWLDPLRMRTAVDVIVTELVRLDPPGAAGYRERGEAVKRALSALHERIEAQRRGWSSSTMVTFHGSFGYFAERYDLTIAAVIEPFPGREPTPRYMQEVIAAIRASGARALFSEPQLDPRPARVIAREAGVTLHQLDPVGGTDGVESYEALLLHDAEVLGRALGGGG